jgi:ribosomal protein L16
MKTKYWIKKFKFKFIQKQLYHLKGYTKSNFFINFTYGFLLKSLKSLLLGGSAIEAGRKIIRHFVKKFIKIIINFICNKSITEKSNGVRMGKGKGNIKNWVSFIKPGRFLYFLCNINSFQAHFLLNKASKKFNFKTLILQNFIFKSNFLTKNLFY